MVPSHARVSGPWPGSLVRVWGRVPGSGGGVSKGVVVAEGFEPGREPAGFAFGVHAAGEVVGAGSLSEASRPGQIR